MSAASILAIPDGEPERLFRDQAAIAALYHELVKTWHPDARPGDPRATEVMVKLSKLYAQAKRKSADGTWEEPGVRTLRPRDGRAVKIRYRARSKFELGEVLIGTRHVTYVVPREHEDLVISGLRAIGTIRFPTAEFRDSLEQFFPKTLKVLELEGGGWSVSLAKDPDDVLISDLAEVMGGRVPPEHVAWMVSSMLNLLSYLGQVQQMTVNGLTPSTVFANPRKHSVSFLGGWWYAARVGSGISALPPETYRLAPNQLRIHKKASPELDLACVKHIARTALGDPSGGSLRTRGDVRKEVAEFLLTPAGRSAVAEYKSWYEVLGKRKFVPLRVTGEDVYPLNN